MLLPTKEILNPSNDVDLKFLAKILNDVGWWLNQKTMMSTPGIGPNLNQPFTPSFGMADYSDPMANFIAGIGRA
jgi:hypothetical protein